MIDLKKIEEKIDSLLETETKESLTNWLISKRSKKLNQILGRGTFVGLQNYISSIYSSDSNFTNVQSKNNIEAISQDYSNAA